MAPQRSILARVIALLTVASLGQGSLVYQEGWQEKSCARVLHHVTHADVITPSPPDLTGRWVSYRCEIRSGPEYVLRDFSFQNGTFTSTIYRYADPDCSQPMYAIHSRGTHKLQSASWTVRGGTEAKYEVISADAIPYNKKASSYVSFRLSKVCNDVLADRFLKPYSKYLIYSLPLDYKSVRTDSQNNTNSSLKEVKKEDSEEEKEIDCFSALNFTLHELQLVMIEVHRRHHRHHHGRRHWPLFHDELQQQHSETEKSSHRHRQHRDYQASQDHIGAAETDVKEEVYELLLGALHSKPTKRQGHRPSSFQTALKRAHTPGCGVCERVSMASPLSPPRLTAHPGTLLSLEGQWVSTRCESRQYGMFLTRWLEFLSDGQSWRGVYDYYHESLCRHPSFSLHAKGSYAGGTDSKLVAGAKDFSFKVTHLKVTPHDQSTADSMNHYNGNGCGKAHAWKVGESQDVTWTGGCVTLGIRLPNMERDIMKMEITRGHLRLFVGQRLVDKLPGTAYQYERPTAFQEPLVKCSAPEDDEGLMQVAGIAMPLSAKEGSLKSGKTSGSKENAILQKSVVVSIIMCSVLVG